MLALQNVRLRAKPKSCAEVVSWSRAASTSCYFHPPQVLALQNVRLRAKPKSCAEVVSILEQGREYEVLQAAGEWYEVRAVSITADGDVAAVTGWSIRQQGGVRLLERM